MSLDFEGDDGGSVDVTITASGDGESATHTVTVTINDLNEAPTIDVRDGEEVPQKGVTSSLTIDESVMGADLPPLALIEVMDADAADATTGQAGADMVTFSGDMADYFEVKLDPEDGLWLALKADASLDYETVGDSVMVTVTYTDGAGQSVSADVTVTVNNVNESPRGRWRSCSSQRRCSSPAPRTPWKWTSRRCSRIPTATGSPTAFRTMRRSG